MKAILIGAAIGLLVAAASNGFVWTLVFIVPLIAFMDWSGDGDGRQWRSRD